MARDQKDHYYRKAKEDGYRARSVYKLKQINQKFHIIKRGDTVIDLGAAPGGWLQVAKQISGGKVIGVDIEAIEPLPGVITLKADLTNSSTIDLVRDYLDGQADVVICDASPNLTGAWNLDHARSIDLARSALELAKRLLKPKGDFLVKVFQGDMFDQFLSDIRQEFSRVKAFSPPASRKESAEIYLIAKKLLTGPVRQGEIHEVEIEALGKSGDGIAMIDGFAVIVKGANMGEKLKVKISSVKSNFAFAEIMHNDK
jgi:23S rRNA (uridine2552-2'-O)-methyltransferase